MNTPQASRTHLVLVPSFNSGTLLAETVRGALAVWQPVWVVVDASTDGSDAVLEEIARDAGTDALRVVRRERNGGKGAAVLTGAEYALAAGYTHALVLDADGQHPAERIADFMAASMAEPGALVLGRPVFGPEAPAVRLQGRKLSVGMVWLEILGAGIDDPLFGFRIYPLAPLARVMRRARFARRYDFDPEVAVRMFWDGVPTLNLPAACRYRSREDGGISHFHYLRDNVRMVWLHTRLVLQLVFLHLWRKRQWRRTKR